MVGADMVGNMGHGGFVRDSGNMHVCMWLWLQSLLCWDGSVLLCLSMSLGTLWDFDVHFLKGEVRDKQPFFRNNFSV